VALPGDRFIVRTYSPQRTFAGGEILDAHAQKHRGRERAASRARLSEFADADRAERLAFFAEAAGAIGLPRAEAAARTGWRDDVLESALAECKSGGAVVDAEGVVVGAEVLRSLARAAVEEVEAYHRSEPLSRGLARETLRERVFARAAPEIFRAAMKTAEDDGSLVSERDLVRASGHTLELSPADSAARERLEQIYRDAALEAPALEDALARAVGSNASREHARKILRLLIDAGTLVRVREDLLFHRDALDRLVASLRAYADGHGPERLIDVAAFKELSGVSRKYAIPLLEHFDRTRVTRRAGDRRIIL
jgi:selenocysteine-specific elongation factor